MSNLNDWALEVFTKERACQQAAARGEPNSDTCKKNADDVTTVVVALKNHHHEGGYREKEVEDN